MRIKKITIKDFKRFTDLTITDLPESAKLVVLVGPNGSGKTSLFDAFNYYHRLKGFSDLGDKHYIIKQGKSHDGQWYANKVDIKFHEVDEMSANEIKNKFYFRTAYRNQADFTITNLSTQENPTQRSKFIALNGNDITVSENYQRLVSQTLAGVFQESNNLKTVEQYREELIGKIKSSLNNVFDELTLTSIGNPLVNGSFYFEKGDSKDFHYKNLSAGEKSVFDIILDIIIKSEYYPNSIFCIDEPEAHMHTSLQSKLLLEMYHLIPQESQLWIATHSIGMLKKAEELEKNNPGSVVFLNFDNKDFDSIEVVSPTKIDKSIWDKFFELALDDFANLISPKTIVFCEGTSQGRKYKNFDAQIYSKIFANNYHDVTFVSIGSCADIENNDNQSVKVISAILKASKIIKFIDRDGRSAEEIQELTSQGISTLEKRHIENYLLDDEIIRKLCMINGKEDKITECLEAKNLALKSSISRYNPSDDIKSASGEICVALKKILELTQAGNNQSAFLRDTIAPLITEETNVYQELENQIFGKV